MNSLIKYLKTQSPHGYGYDYWRDKVLLLESFSNKIQVPNSVVAFQQRLNFDFKKNSDIKRILSLKYTASCHNRTI